MGALCLDGCPQPIPQNPTWGGDIPIYKAGQLIELQPATNECITWVHPDGMHLLIADRCLLTGSSWDDLAENGFVGGKVVEFNGKMYRFRLIQVGEGKDAPNEWNAALFYSGTGKDELWHYRRMSFWGSDAITEDGATEYRAFRGGEDSQYWNYQVPSMISNYIGFRPALELIPPIKGKSTILDGHTFCIAQQLSGKTDSNNFCPILYPTAFAPNGNITVDYSIFGAFRRGATFKAYTLLMDGAPVKQNPFKQRYKQGSYLSFTDEFCGNEYLITWEIRNGIAYTAAPILRGIQNTQLSEMDFPTVNTWVI